MSSMLSHDAFREAMAQRDASTIIASLPQREAVNREDVERWMAFMADHADFHDPYWHYRRKFGIGGSESIVAVQVAALMRGENPSFDPFANPYDLVADKTFRALPSGASRKMMRGNFLERGIADMLLADLRAERLDECMEAMNQVGVLPDHPWLVGNPDLMMRHQGKNWLVDIKAPDEAGTEVPFRYQVQLHHYAARAIAAGIKIDGLMIGNFDYANGRVLPVVIEFNPRLAKDILQGGSRLWEHVLEGRVPRYETTSVAVSGVEVRPLEDEEKARIHALEAKAVTAKLLIDRLNEVVNACQKEIRSLHEGRLARGVKASDLGLSLYSVNVSEAPRSDAVDRLVASGKVKQDDLMIPQKVDVAGLVECVRALGVDPTPYILSYKVNDEKLKGVLVEHDVPFEEVFDVRASYVYRTPKSGEKLEFHQSVQDKIERLVSAMKLDVDSSASAPASSVSPNP